VPTDLRDDIEPIISQVARIASQRYRKGGDSRGGSPALGSPSTSRPAPAANSPVRPIEVDYPSPGTKAAGRLGGASDDNATLIAEQRPRQAIEVAALAAGEQDALERIVASLRQTAPEVARDLGW
jgi:hypothetical protein